MKIASPLITWQRQFGRHGLPWQETQDPYKVWLSEIMLQQTQVATVLPYYQRFLSSFPDVRSLAAASSQAVMSHWAGLGYYARARNLHQCAKVVVNELGGEFPRDSFNLAKLPGIGPSTAAAIAAFCYAERISILDGNVKRLLSRYFAIQGDPGLRKVEKQLWSLANQEVPSVKLLAKDPQAMSTYTQGLMDLGATVCVRSNPRCSACPLQKGCQAFIEGRTQELPTPKARKALPTRTTFMLVIHSQKKIMLEQRPADGIWGGLWSLPELQDSQALQAYCRSIGVTIVKQETMANLLHTFTHFKLVIQPILIEATSAAKDWVPLSTLQNFGLPTPIRKLLTGMTEQQLFNFAQDDNGQYS